MIAPKKNIPEDETSSSPPTAIQRDTTRHHGSSSDSDDERPATLETFMSTLTFASSPPARAGSTHITSTPARLPSDGIETTVTAPKLVILPSKPKKDEKEAHPSHESSSLGKMALKPDFHPLESAQVASTENLDVALAAVKEHGMTMREKLKHRFEAKKSETTPTPSEVAQPQPESPGIHMAAQVNTKACDLASPDNTANQDSAKVSHHDISVSPSGQLIARSPGVASEIGKLSQADKLIVSTFEDTSKKILISRMQRLTAEEVALNDWEFVVEAAKTTVTGSLPSSIISHPTHKKMVLEKFDKISEEYRRLWIFLRKRLMKPMEKEFEVHVCFSDADFDATVQNYEGVAFQDNRQKNAYDMEQLQRDKVKQFIDEYRRKNKTVQKLEDQMAQAALKLCTNYYLKQMELRLGNAYSDQIDHHHEEISKDATHIFVGASGLKSSYLKKKYDSEPRATIEDLKMVFISSNRDRKLELEKKIRDLVDEATTLYQRKVDKEVSTMLQQHKYQVSLINSFEKIDWKARSDAESWFNSQTATFSHQIVAPSIKKKLKQVLSSQYNLKRQELLEQEAEEKRRRIEEEQKEREAANLLKRQELLEREAEEIRLRIETGQWMNGEAAKLKRQELLKQEAEERRRQFETGQWMHGEAAKLKRQELLKQEAEERRLRIETGQWMNGEAAKLKRQELLEQEDEGRRRQFETGQWKKRKAANYAATEKKSAQFCTMERFHATGNQYTSIFNQQNHISRPDEISWGHLIQLTKTTVAFHLGLHRTKMGIVNKHGVIQVFTDIDNCLYFEGSKFVTTDADTAKKLKLGKETSLHDLLVKNELHKLYEVRIDGVTHQFRIEELISFILATLKWETEFEQLWHIHNCLIVVPQSLNENQRQAVKDAAELAGFLHTMLINDTSAMALAYVMDQGVRDSQFITVNTHEGFIDAATFTVSYLDGSIDRDKVTGDTFVDVGSRGFFESVEHVLNLGFAIKDSSRRAKAIFSHGELATTRKVTAILSSRAEEARYLADSMSNVSSRIVSVDSIYALMGAGYLIAIDSMDPDHKIYQKFAQTRRLTENTVQYFRDKLLRKNPDPVKKSASSSTALPLSANQMEFHEKKTKYYLRTTRALHTEKMRWLQLVHNVHHQLDDPRCQLDQIRGQEIMEQLQAQRSAFKNLKAGSAGQDTVLQAQMGVYSLLKQLQGS